MERKTDLLNEMVEAARELMNSTEDAREIRRALSVVLSGVWGLTLPAVAEIMGRFRIRARMTSIGTGKVKLHHVKTPWNGKTAAV